MKNKKFVVVSEAKSNKNKKNSEYKIYLTSDYSNKIMVQGFAEYLSVLFDKEIGIKSTWHILSLDALEEQEPSQSFQDISESDCIIAIATINPDVCVDVGYAMALKKDVVYLRPKELDEDDPVFVNLMEEVDVYGTRHINQYDNPNLRFNLILNDMENIIRFLKFRIQSISVPTEKDIIKNES